MRQIRDEDLILFFYGEADDPEEVRGQLAGSAELRARYQELCRALAFADEGLAVPDRPDSYGAEVWARLEPRLAESPRSARSGLPGGPAPLLRAPGLRRSQSLARTAGKPGPGSWRWAGLAAAAVLLLTVGFIAGRFWTFGPRTPAPLSAEARQRILVRTVAAHLERSERLLTELANAETEGLVDVSAERKWARDLLAANRLYRQSTRQGGRPQLTSLLDQLEPFLVELSHGPAEIPADELSDLRARIEEQALLFKMRVVSQRLERAGSPTL